MPCRRLAGRKAGHQELARGQPDSVEAFSECARQGALAARDNGFWLLSGAPCDLRRLQVLGRVERRRWTARVAAGDVNRADSPSYDAMTRFLEKGLYE